MLATDKLIKELNDILTHHVISTKNLSKANLNDQAVLSEVFCAEFFSILLSVSLKSANPNRANNDSIDLEDRSARLAVQVTVREDREKVEATLQTFCEHGRFNDFDRLYIAILGHKPTYRKPFTIDPRMTFDVKENVISLPQIIQRAGALQLDALRSLARIAHQYLPIHQGNTNTWREVGVDFAILNRQVEFPWSRGSDHALQRLSYRYEQVGDVMVVTPQLPYLELLDKEEPVPGLRYWDTPFVWDYPCLDVKVINRTEKPLYISEGIFQVSESRPDVRPIPVVSDQTYSMYLGLRNAGWGVMRKASVAFNLTPSDGKPKDLKDLSFDQYQFSKNVGDIDHACTVDLAESFKVLGVDSVFLRASWEETSEGSELFASTDFPGQAVSEEQFHERKKAALGRFFLDRPPDVQFGFPRSERGAAHVTGELKYSYEVIGGADAGKSVDAAVRFYTVVWVSEPRPSAPMAPSFEYELELPSQGKDYQVQLSLNQVLNPGESDRFNIRIASKASSCHEFSLELKEADAKTIVTKKIRLHMIVARSLTPPSPPPPILQDSTGSEPRLLVGSGKRIIW